MKELVVKIEYLCNCEKETVHNLQELKEEKEAMEIN